MAHSPKSGVKKQAAGGWETRCHIVFTALAILCLCHLVFTGMAFGTFKQGQPALITHLSFSAGERIAESEGERERETSGSMEELVEAELVDSTSREGGLVA